MIVSNNTDFRNERIMRMTIKKPVNIFKIALLNLNFFSSKLAVIYKIYLRLVLEWQCDI